MKYKFYDRIIEIPDHIHPPDKFTSKFAPLTAIELRYVAANPGCTVSDLNSLIIESSESEMPNK